MVISYHIKSVTINNFVFVQVSVIPIVLLSSFLLQIAGIEEVREAGLLVVLVESLPTEPPPAHLEERHRHPAFGSSGL